MEGEGFGVTFGMSFTSMQVLVEKVDVYYVMMLLNVSWNSEGGAFRVAMSMTRKRRYCAREGNFIPRVRRKPISGGGGSDGRFRESSETGEMNEDFMKDFPNCLERSCFQIVPEDGNGHCGVLALQRAKRRYLGAPKNDVVSQGRQELVDAYRKHRSICLKDHGSWFNATDEDFDRRISIHNGRMPGGAGRRTSTSFEAINASSATGIPNLVR